MVFSTYISSRKKPFTGKEKCHIRNIMAQRSFLPFLAALLFTLHPVHTEAVASIVGRAELLSGFFFILSIILYRFCASNAIAALRVATDIRAQKEVHETDTNHRRVRQEKDNKYLVCASIALGIGSALACAGATFCKEQGVMALPSAVACDLIRALMESFHYGCITSRRPTKSLSGTAKPHGEIKSETGKLRGAMKNETRGYTTMKHKEVIGVGRDLSTESVGGIRDVSMWIRVSLATLTTMGIAYFRLYTACYTPPRFYIANNPVSRAKSFVERALTLNFLAVYHFYLLVFPRSLSVDWSMGSIQNVHSISPSDDFRPLVTIIVYLMGTLFVRFGFSLPLRSSAHRSFVCTQSLCLGVSSF